MLTIKRCLQTCLQFTLLAGIPAAAHATLLLPQYAGTFQNGDGANSQWVQVAEDWRGTTYGAEPWGTGIWSLDDQAAVMRLAAGDPFVTQTLTTRVDQINFGDQEFITAWGATWTLPMMPPIFDNAPNEYQDNWAARFTGYIAIAKPGDYNFGVLSDDGFRFTFAGAGGTALSLQMDALNPRDRVGFDEDLQLLPGLYAYQLDAYERLEAGVIQLAWSTPDAPDFTPIPEDNLHTNPVPEPSMSLLLLAGAGALGWHTLRRKQQAA